MNTIPFNARRFRSTAEYYSRYRVPYPPELLQGVAARLGLMPGDRVLDLGCGPAMLAIGFAGLGMQVVGMDPESDMLAAAQAAAADAAVAIELVRGSSYDLGPHLGRFSLVTMGRSFHWMDRPATLAALDKLIVPGGAVALFHDRSIERDPDWRPLLNDLAARHSPSWQQMAERHRDPSWHRHEPVLLQSAFSAVETRGCVFAQALDIDAIIGRAYSMSVTSPQSLGAERAAFEAELRAGLLALSPKDQFRDVVAAEAVIAFRPGETPAISG